MITVLFGAGASYPFNKTHLSTAYITEQVKKKENWESVLSEYSQQNNDGYETPDINRIISSLNSKLNEGLHFEQLAEVVDKISSTSYDFQPDSNMLNRMLYNLNVKIDYVSQSQYIPFFFVKLSHG